MNLTDLIEEIISNTDVTLTRFEKENKKFPLIEWEYDQTKVSSLKVVNEDVYTFFSMLISLNKFDSVFNSNNNPETYEYEDLLEYLFSDIIMSILNDSLIKLMEFTRLKRERNKYPEIINELYYSFDEFETNIRKFIRDYDFTEKEKLLDIIGSYRDVIHYKVPKIIFPWYAYALTYTYKYLGPNLKIIKEKHLPLFWSKSEYPNEEELFIRSQRDLQSFMNILREKNNNHNKSLNLFLFNQTTNLYDVYNSVDIFKDTSYYMWSEKFSTSMIDNMDKSVRYKDKQELFDNISKVVKLDNLGVRTLMIDNYYNKTLFESDKVWFLFNRIFDYCKDSLVKLIEEKFLILYQNDLRNVPSDICIDYTIFKLFSKFEPFDQFIEVAFKEGNPPVYTLSIDNDNSATHLYEAYGYAYKSFYKSKRNSNKKD
ncbi:MULTISPECIES: hypothetical protein [unclassified Niallia]|uniref:hypothetical protein n=1 Tax=unclassified Niallia TaxID=2837522 RepID=UPI0030F66207